MKSCGQTIRKRTHQEDASDVLDATQIVIPPQEEDNAINSNNQGENVYVSNKEPPAIKRKTLVQQEKTEDEVEAEQLATRYVLFPIQNKAVWMMYKKAQASFWTVDELKLAADRKDWEALTSNEQHFLKHVLAFFAASDGIVNENLVLRFMRDVKNCPEALCFYGFQIAMENIHSETYSLLIDTYIHDTVTKNRLFQAMEKIPCIQKKAAWAQKWLTSKRGYAERLVCIFVHLHLRLHFLGCIRGG